MTTLTVAIEGVGFLGPGLPNWPACAAVLNGAAPYTPARTLLPLPEVLPPAERRRAGRVIRLALAVGAEAVGNAGRDPRTLASVFSSSGGDGDNCHAICEALADGQRLISPTRFHNSVHNAAAGYWSIAYGCAEASITLCAYDASFAAGLLEAATQVSHRGQPVLLVAYDADYPPPLRVHRPIGDACGLSLIVGPPDSAVAQAMLRLSLCAEPPDTIARPELEALRCASPAARGLPLLAQLTQARGSRSRLEYLDGRSLALELIA